MRSALPLSHGVAVTSKDRCLQQRYDAISGERVQHLYDELGRLTKAETVGPEWGQTYSLDGFGNLYAKAATKGGGGPTMNILVDQATNRVAGSSGFGYDPYWVLDTSSKSLLLFRELMHYRMQMVDGDLVKHFNIDMGILTSERSSYSFAQSLEHDCPISIL